MSAPDRPDPSAGPAGMPGDARARVVTLRRLRPVGSAPAGWVPRTAVGPDRSAGDGAGAPPPDRRARLRAVGEGSGRHGRAASERPGATGGSEADGAAGFDAPTANGTVRRLDGFGAAKEFDPAHSARSAHTARPSHPAGVADPVHSADPVGTADPAHSADPVHSADAVGAADFAGAPDATAAIVDRDGPRPAEKANPPDAAGATDSEPDPARPAWAARLVRRGPWGALAERWVPEPLRGARIDPGRRGAVLLSVIATLAAVVAAVGVWWGRPQPRPVAPVALAPAESAAAATGSTHGSISGVAPASAGASATDGRQAADATPGPGGDGTDSTPGDQSQSAPSPSTAGPIVVSVTGRVRHPGLVHLTSGARVADAITAAGGPLDPADLTGLNLAARLADGDSVVVAGPGGSSVDEASTDVPPATAGALTGPGSTTAPVDLNTADAAALDSLPGVGPVTAAAIIAWRTEHGPFTDIEQLQAIPGIGPAKYAQIAPHVTVSS